MIRLLVGYMSLHQHPSTKILVPLSVEFQKPFQSHPSLDFMHSNQSFIDSSIATLIGFLVLKLKAK
jgi:hypothetical protein